MRPISEPRLRSSFVNCSRGEASAMTLPRGFGETPWDELVVLGWRDPRAPLRGYLGSERDGDPVGIGIRAADTRMSYPACDRRARTGIPPWLRERDLDEVAAERTAELARRLHGFLDSVLR